jgi:sigma-E factor negative regulatory protein RseC
MKAEFEVVKVSKQTMTLKPKQGSCGSCQAKNTCGTGLLAQFFKTPSVKRKRLIGVAQGDNITLEIESRRLFWHAFQLYIVPILALFLGSVLGVKYFTNELHAVLAGLVAFLAVFLLIKFFIKK